MRLAQGQVRPLLADCPVQLFDLIKDPKAMQAMMRMKKFDIAELERVVQS